MTELSDSTLAGEAFDTRLAAERPRLVGLCARLSGDPSVAEDLAQETLAEAWRLLARLRQPEGLASWLNAIARNVCLRWERQRGRETARSAELLPDDDTGDDLDTLPAADGELSIYLERAELVALLDRALALLPDDTRAALVATYVRELPHLEVAARLGLSEGALRVRLHRGRLALRRVLTGDLRDEANALGLPLPEELQTGWRQTRIWCPFCGNTPLEYRRDAERGSYMYRCTGLCHYEGVIAGQAYPNCADGRSSPKPILSRQCLTLDHYYRDMLATDRGHCDICGSPLHVYRRTPDQIIDPLPREHGIVLECPRCGPFDGSSAWHLMLDTPETQRFWRRHPRMRALPVSEVEAEGRPALVTGFESTDGQARLVIVSDRWTYEVLRVHGGTGREGTRA
jgi:RNA polymerase sigma factor (sigma-70 family)